MTRHLFATITVIAALSTGVYGCGSQETISTPGEEDYTPPPVDDGSGVPPGATETTCQQVEDCGYWFCECDDGFVVNAANCQNGYCLDPQSTCPDACGFFDHGEWTGNYGGGPTAPTDPPIEDCGTLGSNDPECDACSKASCCQEMAACDDNISCLNYWDCVVFCPPGDLFCQDDCALDYPDGVFDFEDLQACLNDSCQSECS